MWTAMGQKRWRTTNSRFNFDIVFASNRINSHNAKANEISVSPFFVEVYSGQRTTTAGSTGVANILAHLNLLNKKHECLMNILQYHLNLSFCRLLNRHIAASSACVREVNERVAVGKTAAHNKKRLAMSTNDHDERHGKHGADKSLCAPRILCALLCLCGNACENLY